MSLLIPSLSSIIFIVFNSKFMEITPSIRNPQSHICTFKSLETWDWFNTNGMIWSSTVSHVFRLATILIAFEKTEFGKYRRYYLSKLADLLRQPPEFPTKSSRKRSRTEKIRSKRVPSDLIPGIHRISIFLRAEWSMSIAFPSVFNIRGARCEMIYRQFSHSVHHNEFTFVCTPTHGNPVIQQNDMICLHQGETTRGSYRKWRVDNDWILIGK